MNPYLEHDRSQHEREARSFAAQRAMHTEHRRLFMSAEGIQKTLQNGDDAEQVVDLELCKILQRLVCKPEYERTATERALVNRLDDLAWTVADQRDYSDALDEEEMTRAETRWEATRDRELENGLGCALLAKHEGLLPEPQA